MAVNIDLKNGSIWQRTKDGDRATRIAHITGVTGSVDALLKAALDDASMPNYGDAHPQDSNITVQSITVQPLSGTTYEARIEYYNDPGSVTGSSNATVRSSATTTPEQTETDISGNRLEARFLGSYYSGPGLAYSKYWTAEVERPRVTYDFEYTTSTFPKTEIDTYLNKVNSATWNGYAVKTILCTAINVNTEGDNYRVVFSFAYNENTWQFIGGIKEKDMILPLSAHPSDPDAGVNLTDGTKAFDVYDSVSFATLGFTL